MLLEHLVCLRELSLQKRHLILMRGDGGFHSTFLFSLDVLVDPGMFGEQ